MKLADDPDNRQYRCNGMCRCSVPWDCRFLPEHPDVEAQRLAKFNNTLLKGMIR